MCQRSNNSDQNVLPSVQNHLLMVFYVYNRLNSIANSESSTTKMRSGSILCSPLFEIRFTSYTYIGGSSLSVLRGSIN